MLTLLHDAGNVYIADFYNNRVRKVTVSTGIITTVAGTATSSYSGDGGPATSAALYYPSGVSIGNSFLIVITCLILILNSFFLQITRARTYTSLILTTIVSAR